MLEKARCETDPEKRKLLYLEIQVFLNPELPVEPLNDAVFYTPANGRLTNFSIDSSWTPVLAL